ncbi:MAG: hypothetical protein ACRCYU_08050 [Nocardioides sp.]
MGSEEMLDLPLTDDERELLCRGLREWGGPARCTEELAVAMGFRSVADLVVEAFRLADVVHDGRPLPEADWVRVLFATEIAFASDVVGSGLDWTSTVGMSDVRTVQLLRSLQRKLPRTGLPRPGLARMDRLGVTHLGEPS